ncbi:MAG: GNAT family N-acetyltransferase [Alphaproteobacteria bacterium]|jgi:ribosomal protein S18 acetylase RimI-like enzyme
MICDIRKLLTEDWPLWKVIRLEALRLHPTAYGKSYEEECSQPDHYFKDCLLESDIFGAFVEEILAGVAGFSLNNPLKAKHKGVFFALYVKEPYQNQGIAGRLVEMIIQHAKSQVVQLHCAVNTTNAQALSLYQKMGFNIFGTEPRALKIGNNFHDLHQMVLKLD